MRSAKDRSTARSRSPIGPDWPTRSSPKAGSSTRGPARRVTRRSRAIVYTGFQWRGRSADTPDDPGTWREVAFIERNGQEIKGRWFTGAYDETGIDITLRRVSNDPLVIGHRPQLAEDVVDAAQRVRIYGANLPASASRAADIDFGQGVKVSRVVSAVGRRLIASMWMSRRMRGSGRAICRSADRRERRRLWSTARSTASR